VAKLSWVVGQEIWFFKEIPRAMSLAKQLIDELPRSAHGRVIVAERLTSAKGRFDRKWFAEKGGLWLAISLYNEILPQHFGLFSLLFGLAMVRVCHELSAKEVKLKWISDPHFQGKKLGGTLIERYKDWFIVGLGLNINNEPPEGLPAESLKRLIRREIPLTTALNLLLKWINYYYDALLSYERRFFEEDAASCPIIEDFYHLSDTIGRCVAFSYNLDEEEFIVGKVHDILPDGSLLLKVEGDLLSFNSGEVIYLF